MMFPCQQIGGAKFTDAALARIETMMPLEDSDEVVQTLTLNCSDVFDYYAFNFVTPNYINLNYEVEVGESEEGLSPLEGNLLENGQKLQFSFTRNIKKNYFVKITVKDFVGNVRTETRIIPGQVSIIGDDYKSKDSWAGGHYNQINVGRYDDFVNLISTYPGVTYGFYYFFPDNEYGYKIIKINQSNGYIENRRPWFYYDYKYNDDNIHLTEIPQENLAPNGVYHCYILPFYKYGEQFYYGTIAAGDYYFKTSMSSCTANLPDSNDDFECILDAPVTNLGYRTGHITFDDNFQLSEGVEYGIKYAPQPITSYSQYSYSGLDFILPSDKTYNVYIYAKSPQGGMSVSSVYKEVDATYDNFSPTMPVLTKEQQKSISSHLHGPDITRLYLTKDTSFEGFFPKDNTSLKTSEDDDDYCEFKYCITPYVGDMVYLTYDDFLERELDGDVYTAKFQKNAESVILNFDNFYYESNSTLTFKVEDDNENYLIYNLNVKLDSTFTKPVFNVIKIRKAEEYVEGYSSAPYQTRTLWLQDPDRHNGIISFGLKDNKWEFLYQSINSAYHNYNAAEKEVYDNSVFISCSLASQTNCSLYSDINYICKEYEEKRVYGEDISVYCKSKSIIPAFGDAYQVFYDAPCFAHTMAFPTDQLDYLEGLINSNKGNFEEYQIWETTDREYGVKVLNSSFAPGTATYYAPVDEIPDGYSYVTIVHFADRTAVMSEVKQK